MVLWDTAGEFCTGSNDASAPKPCQNPESSFDAGFVASNAAVQTSVVVYIYIYIYVCVCVCVCEGVCVCVCVCAFSVISLSLIHSRDIFPEGISTHI